MDARTLSRIVPLLFTALLSAPGAIAATYVVKPDGTGDYRTITTTILWDNGPLITGDCPNNNPPGAESQIASDRTIFGYEHQLWTGFRVADDYTLPEGRAGASR